jgi:hypothetical protein
LYRYFVVVVTLPTVTLTETGRFRASYTLALTFQGKGSVMLQAGVRGVAITQRRKLEISERSRLDSAIAATAPIRIP